MLTFRSVRQLLEVLRLFRDNQLSGVPLRESYTKAVHTVAEQYGVTYQTIGDGCRRRLELENIGDLYRLLSAWMSGDANPLLRQLEKHSRPASHCEIEKFFEGVQPINSLRQETSFTVPLRDESVTISFRLQPSDARLLRALAELDGISVGEMTAKIVSASVKDRIKIVARQFLDKPEAPAFGAGEETNAAR